MAKLILLFTIVPLVELYLLMALGDAMGFGPTVALVLLTGTLGAALAKREGGRVLREWRGALDGSGAPPSDGVLEGVLILVGGVLLVTPGVLTDISGMSLLFPPTRQIWAKFVRKWLDKRIEEGRIQMETRVVGGAGGMGMGSMGMAGFETFDVAASAARPHRSRGAVIEVEGVEVEGVEVEGVEVSNASDPNPNDPSDPGDEA